MEGQLSLFDMVTPEQTNYDDSIRINHMKEYPESEKLAYEKDVVGLYLSGHRWFVLLFWRFAKKKMRAVQAGR